MALRPYTAATWGPDSNPGRRKLSGPNLQTIEDAVAAGYTLFNPLDKKYGTADQSGTNDSAPVLQAMFNDMSAGQACFIPGGLYRIDTPLTVPNGIFIFGSGWGHSSSDGTTLKIGGSPSGGTWNKQGMLQTAAYRQTGGTATPGAPIHIRDLKLDANNATVGNGLIIMNQQCTIEKLDCLNFAGTTAGSDGYCIWLAGQTQPSDASAPVTLATNCVNNVFKTLRLESNNSRVYCDDTNSRYTDAVLEHCVCIIQPTASNVPDIDLAHAGGWLIHDTHHNGSGGHCIRLRSAFQTAVYGCNFDGWGIGNTSGTNHAVRVDTFGTGVGSTTSGVQISMNRIKIRATQVSTGTYNVFSIANGTAGVANVQIVGNNIYAEGGVTGTCNFFDLGSTGGVDGVIADNTFDLNGAAGNIHAASQATNGNALFYNGNTFQYATATPSAGWWPRGMVVWNSAPSAAGTPGWVCTTAGTPGTWKAMANLAA